MLLAGALTSALLLPAYRIAAEEGAVAAHRMRRMRFVLTATVLCLLAVLVGIGPWLVAALYDDRYVQAGHILVWIALMQMW